MHCHSNILIQTQGNLCSLKHRVHFFSPLLTESASAYTWSVIATTQTQIEDTFSFGVRKRQCFEEKSVGLQKAE